MTERLGPLGLKRLHKEQGITWHRSWHPTCLYFEEKNLARMGCRNWNLGPRMAQKWSKMIQMPKKCIKSSYLANYYTNFIHFEMPGQIWTKMIEMAKICRNGCSAHIYTGCHKKGTNKTNKNGQTRQACQHCKVVQRGPKGSKMVNLDVLDHLGPFWARLDPFEQFQTKISFCSKAPPPNPTLSL